MPFRGFVVGVLWNTKSWYIRRNVWNYAAFIIKLICFSRWGIEPPGDIQLRQDNMTFKILYDKIPLLSMYMILYNGDAIKMLSYADICIACVWLNIRSEFALPCCGPVSHWLWFSGKTIFEGMGILIFDIRQSWRGLIFRIGIYILASQHLSIESGPSLLSDLYHDFAGRNDKHG